MGIIKPWNPPLLLLTWKLAPCSWRLWGHSLLLNQLNGHSMTTEHVLMEICKEAGVPDGVVNLVHGFGPNSAGGTNYRTSRCMMLFHLLVNQEQVLRL